MRNPDHFTLNEILYDAQFYQIKGLELLIRKKAVSLSPQAKFSDLVKEKYFKTNDVLEDTDKYVTCQECVLENLNLHSATFENVKFAHPVTFNNCILSSAKFVRCNFTSVISFTNVDLEKTHFDHCRGVSHDLSTRFHISDTDILEAIVSP